MNDKDKQCLENQIKRIKDLIPTESSKEYPIKYLEEQLKAIVQNLEDIKNDKPRRRFVVQVEATNSKGDIIQQDTLKF